MQSPAKGIHSHTKEDAIESDRGERVVAFLRARHPVKTADHVAARANIRLNTVKTWLQRGSAPDADGYTALWLAYGPEFLVAALGLPPSRLPAWLKKALRDQRAAELKAEIAVLEAKLAGVSV